MEERQRREEVKMRVGRRRGNQRRGRQDKGGKDEDRRTRRERSGRRLRGRETKKERGGVLTLRADRCIKMEEWEEEL